MDQVNTPFVPWISWELITSKKLYKQIVLQWASMNRGVFCYITFFLSQHPTGKLTKPAGDEAITLNDSWIPRKGLRDGNACYDLIVVAVQEGILGPGGGWF